MARQQLCERAPLPLRDVTTPQCVTADGTMGRSDPWACNRVGGGLVSVQRDGSAADDPIVPAVGDDGAAL
jgi:hypothetical protein